MSAWDEQHARQQLAGIDAELSALEQKTAGLRTMREGLLTAWPSLNGAAPAQATAPKATPEPAASAPTPTAEATADGDRPMTARDYILGALTGRGQTAKQVTAAALAAGWETTSDSPERRVHNVLSDAAKKGDAKVDDSGSKNLYRRATR